MMVAITPGDLAFDKFRFDLYEEKWFRTRSVRGQPAYLSKHTPYGATIYWLQIGIEGYRSRLNVCWNGRRVTATTGGDLQGSDTDLVEARLLDLI